MPTATLLSQHRRSPASVRYEVEPDHCLPLMNGLWVDLYTTRAALKARFGEISHIVLGKDSARTIIGFEDHKRSRLALYLADDAARERLRSCEKPAEILKAILDAHRIEALSAVAYTFLEPWNPRWNAKPHKANEAARNFLKECLRRSAVSDISAVNPLLGETIRKTGDYEVTKSVHRFLAHSVFAASSDESLARLFDEYLAVLSEEPPEGEGCGVSEKRKKKIRGGVEQLLADITAIEALKTSHGRMTAVIDTVRALGGYSLNHSADERIARQLQLLKDCQIFVRESQREPERHIKVDSLSVRNREIMRIGRRKIDYRLPVKYLDSLLKETADLTAAQRALEIYYTFVGRSGETVGDYFRQCTEISGLPWAMRAFFQVLQKTFDHDGGVAFYTRKDNEMREGNLFALTSQDAQFYYCASICARPYQSVSLARMDLETRRVEQLRMSSSDLGVKWTPTSKGYAMHKILTKVVLPKTVQSNPQIRLSQLFSQAREAGIEVVPSDVLFGKEDLIPIRSLAAGGSEVEMKMQFREGCELQRLRFQPSGALETLERFALHRSDLPFGPRYQAGQRLISAEGYRPENGFAFIYHLIAAIERKLARLDEVAAPAAPSFPARPG